MPFKASSNDTWTILIAIDPQLQSKNSVRLLLLSGKKLFWRAIQLPHRSVTNIFYHSLFFINSRWFLQIHHTCPKKSWKIKFIKAKYILGSKSSWKETLHMQSFHLSLVVSISITNASRTSLFTDNLHIIINMLHQSFFNWWRTNISKTFYFINSDQREENDTLFFWSKFLFLFIASLTKFTLHTVLLCIKYFFNTIQYGPFWGCLQMGGKKTPLPKIWNTYPTMTKLCTVIPYLKIQKIYKSHDKLLDFCWYQHFFTGNQQHLLYYEIQIYIAL